MDGVEAVDVSLERGLASIRFADAGRVDVVAIRAAIRDNGFTPREAELWVAGTVAEESGRLVLRAPGHARPFVIEEHPDAAGVAARLRADALGRTAAVRGRVPETPRRPLGPLLLEVRGFEPAPR
jgi:hypothetical protein